MKASSILALLSLGLPVLAASIPQYLEDPQNFYVSGVVKEAGTDDEFIPSRPAASNDVTFSWCSDYNQNATCSQMKLKHSWCYDLGALDPKITKQLEGVGASNGRCMMFRNNECKGEHTAMFVGEHLWTRFLCPMSHVKWHKQAASVRCCAGNPADPWCDKKIRSPEGCVAPP
ncbi:hypothetical protein N5P37_008466 [Trichoderma harzianum]|uniref:Uncharacterized protein n=2 Tax=Trichoderma TaxID=5543 RepID=A0A2T4AM50_TRIHA|nr:hypothetical protein M431DRAFT_79555 [Trichoderma harzianum CBS 226.95]KAF3077168.1 hypothetical protein CFAM422_000011 [Trichoderma lentiforme]KAK0758979.1 hypothetical protein N5P37_008466 [Trichoderma harzianum]KAK4075798.1 hypothetical protein Trihar35433_2358 [Trichoderma harzianum]PKK48548.1 hypothetical protein CI102_6441 [Trichoderma harzianum]PTB58143.1 hypothetical protein M431DRAFT_79555 [Trichoderma harzianum CBS 226.95]